MLPSLMISSLSRRCRGASFFAHSFSVDTITPAFCLRLEEEFPSNLLTQYAFSSPACPLLFLRQDGRWNRQRFLSLDLSGFSSRNEFYLPPLPFGLRKHVQPDRVPRKTPPPSHLWTLFLPSEGISKGFICPRPSLPFPSSPA